MTRAHPVRGQVVNSGNLLEDMTPPVNPPEEIDDPNDSKPADWDEREKIPDPDATVSASAGRWRYILRGLGASRFFVKDCQLVVGVAL